MSWIAHITIDGDSGIEHITETGLTHAKAYAKVFQHLYKKILEIHIYENTEA